jgi:hypothetical protein
VVDIKLTSSIKNALLVNTQKMLPNLNDTLESRSWDFDFLRSPPLILSLRPYVTRSDDSRPHGLFVGYYIVPLLTRALRSFKPLLVKRPWLFERFMEINSP